jgi:hypothetical protein
MKKRCHCCEGRFGLIRHYYNRLQFCRTTCVAAYRARLEQQILEKKRRFLALSARTA